MMNTSSLKTCAHARRQAGKQSHSHRDAQTGKQTDTHSATQTHPQTSNYQNQQPTQTAFCGNDILSPSLPSPFPSPNCKVAAWGPLWGKQLLRNLGKGRGRGGRGRAPSRPQEPKSQNPPCTPRNVQALASNLGPMVGKRTSPATRNRTRDHLIAASLYSQMLYQLSYSRLV